MLKRSLNIVSLLPTLITELLFLLSIQFKYRHQLPVANQAERKTITSLIKVGLITIIIILIIIITIMMTITMSMTALIIAKFKFNTKKLLALKRSSI